MSHLVGMEVRLLIEALVAVWVAAYKWLLPSVDPHVRFEVEVQWKSLVAEVTFVWFLPSMNEGVPLEFGVVQESFSAPWVVALEELIPVDSIMLF